MRGDIFMEKKDFLNLKEVGLRVRLQREKLNLSREKFAEIVSLSPFYIGQIERGDRNMSLETLVKISRTLNLSTDYILQGKILYMENIYALEAMEDNYKGEIDHEIKDLLYLLSGLSKDKIELIKDLSKLLLPHLDKN
jgi:transcriptional regulator with XRE-family HTH domain